MSIASPAGAPTFSGDPVSDFQQLTAFPFMVNALEAGTLVAVTASVVGWFMVLRRQSFAGHTLSVMAFPGATGALLIGLPAAAGYFVFCGLSALVLSALADPGGEHSRARESALTGTVQTFGLACGFLFLALYRGVLAGYENLLFGTFVGITRSQVLLLALVLVGIVSFFVIAGRPLLFASVDEPVARAGGVGTRMLGLGFLLVLGLAVAATAQITGVLLVSALLVAPPATAQLLTARIGLSLALAVFFGVVVAWTGLAYFTNYPVGFFVSSVALGLYVLVRLVRARVDRGPRLRGRRLRAV
jgi:zinc/manganese transport system permease protein